MVLLVSHMWAVPHVEHLIIFRTQKFRYNNALFHIKRSTQLMKGLGSNLCRKIK